MTYSLSSGAIRFIDGLFDVRQIREQPQLVPALPGIYGWWFDEMFLPEQATETLRRSGRRLLYVGVAPNRPTKPGVKPRTLRDRLMDHCRGPIASSTLRRTLAALLEPELKLQFRLLGSGKISMDHNDEERLTEWMIEHARVMWSSMAEPWLIEEELLQHGPRFPLNISGSNDDFRHKLKELRANMKEKQKCRPDDGYNRFVAEASDITMLGRVLRYVDYTSEEQRRQNEEHERGMNELFSSTEADDQD